MDKSPEGGIAPQHAVDQAAADDWRRNDRNVVPKDDRLLEHGIYGLHPDDPRGRPFVLLRSQILNALRQMNGRVLAVTSASAANGKSHVAANLACAMSRVGETSLIDLHLRRPVIGERFGLPEGSGITTYSDKEQDFTQYSYRIQDERLAIHAAGPATQDNAELLMSSRLPKLLRGTSVGAEAPICIVDTPPVLESDDMLLIAKHVDGILFVVEEGITTRHDITESFRLLNGTPVVGTLLNKSIAPF